MKARGLWVLVFGFITANGGYYGVRSIAGWLRQRNDEKAALYRFLDQASRRIPEDATVHLLGYSAATRVPLIVDRQAAAATLLYPRPIRVCTFEELAELSRRSPDAWVITYPDPFEEAGSFVGKARDSR